MAEQNAGLITPKTKAKLAQALEMKEEKLYTTPVYEHHCKTILDRHAERDRGPAQVAEAPEPAPAPSPPPPPPGPPPAAPRQMPVNSRAASVAGRDAIAHINAPAVYATDTAVNAHVRSGLYAGMLNQVRPGAKVRVLSMEEELVTVKMIEHARDGFTEPDLGEALVSLDVHSELLQHLAREAIGDRAIASKGVPVMIYLAIKASKDEGSYDFTVREISVVPPPPARNKEFAALSADWIREAGERANRPLSMSPNFDWSSVCSPLYQPLIPTVAGAVILVVFDEQKIDDDMDYLDGVRTTAADQDYIMLASTMERAKAYVADANGQVDAVVYETCWRSTRNYCLEKEGGGKVRMDNCKPDRPCNFKPCTKCNK